MAANCFNTSIVSTSPILTAHAKLLDVLGKPGKYREVVDEVRRHLEAHHAYRNRVQELVAALQAPR